MNVLIAEDNKINSRIVAAVVEVLGDNPICKYDGRKALDYLLDNKNDYPDVIIADMYMPIMNGLELIKNVREFDKNVSIILYTANNELHNEEEYKKQKLDYLNISHFVPKGSGLNSLIDLLKTYSVNYRELRYK